MDRIKNSLITAAYVLLTALFFFGGYALGSRSEDKELVFDAPAETARAVIPAAAVKEGEREEDRTVYTVIIQNGRLCLFKDEGGSRTLISSEEISENIYPSADIAELRRGIEFDSMDKAQELFENFVS